MKNVIIFFCLPVLFFVIFYLSILSLPSIDLSVIFLPLYNVLSVPLFTAPVLAFRNFGTLYSVIGVSAILKFLPPCTHSSLISRFWPLFSLQFIFILRFEPLYTKLFAITRFQTLCSLYTRKTWCFSLHSPYTLYCHGFSLLVGYTLSSHGCRLSINSENLWFQPLCSLLLWNLEVSESVQPNSVISRFPPQLTIISVISRFSPHCSLYAKISRFPPPCSLYTIICNLTPTQLSTFSIPFTDKIQNKKKYLLVDA